MNNTDTRFINNHVLLIGEVKSGLEYSHTAFGEKIYTMYLGTERKSGVLDIFPVSVPEWSEMPEKIEVGDILKIEGRFRSYNEHKKGKNHLILYVHAVSVEKMPYGHKHMNRVTLDGRICKIPRYRETRYGRQITDIILAANRTNSTESDYIPCICWGRNARRVSGYKIGTHVSLAGRIQSREYQKRLSESEFETKIAYEVSANKIEVKQESEVSENEA